MAEQRMSLNVRVRLSAMMFFQYAIHAVWIIQMAAYLDGVLNCTGRQTSGVLNAVPLGALLAPIFVGMVADRFFAGEKVLALLNLVGAALLVWASTVQDPWLLFAALLVQQLLYMPTWAITNSIAIANCQDTEKDLPGIRVWGSIGWVATALFGIVSTKLLNVQWDGTHLPLLGAAALSVVAGLFAFALPHTPPPAAGKKAAVADILGLKALALMKNPSFAVFIVVSLVAMIPFAAYWSFFSLYLSSLGTGIITGTMHLGQFIEIFVMWLLLPIALKKVGVKWTLVLGVAILGLRYLMFMFADGEEMMFLNYGGILVHGFIFSFFFITGYIYADRVAPKEIRAQAQGLIMLVTFGAGMLLGNWINGEIVDANAIVGERVAAGHTLPAAVPAEATLGIEGAKAADSVAYSRALSDDEISLLVAEQQKKDILVERLKREFGDRADLAKGKISDPAEAKAFTFSTWLTLPKPKEGEEAKPLSGAILKIGEGENALQLGLEGGRLSLQAGKAKMTQISPIAAGERVHVAGSFDGETLKLYSGGKLYKRWHWRTVWTYPAAISGALLLLMLLFFKVPPAKKEPTA
ncbi:MAG: MFS transporter [Planctomycetes bacterium]|nr:MFS transporter [Planctomycetota bacterium]